MLVQVRPRGASRPRGRDILRSPPQRDRRAVRHRCAYQCLRSRSEHRSGRRPAEFTAAVNKAPCQLVRGRIDATRPEFMLDIATVTTLTICFPWLDAGQTRS